MIALLGHCSCCGQEIPGMEPRSYPGKIRLDYHTHPFGSGLCIGSLAVMRRTRDYCHRKSAGAMPRE